MSTSLADVGGYASPASSEDGVFTDPATHGTADGLVDEAQAGLGALRATLEAPRVDLTSGQQGSQGGYHAAVERDDGNDEDGSSGNHHLQGEGGEGGDDGFGDDGALNGEEDGIPEEGYEGEDAYEQEGDVGEGAGGAGHGGYPEEATSAGNPSEPRPRRAHDEADDVPDDKKDGELAGGYKEEGNRHFGAGEHETAAACYTEALRYIPRGKEQDASRAVFFSNRAACYLLLGRNEDALYDTDRALEASPGYVKALMRRSTALERLGKLEEALKDLEALHALDPNSRHALEGTERLKKAMADRDEKLKDEMLGKLKDLGNSLLGKFGMSLDNFKAVKDPATGSYSISFQK